MDGISAAASLIAIGQAVAALPKVVQALQSVVKFKAEVAYLINELESLRAFVHEITECVGLFTTSNTPDRLTVHEPASLKQCRRTLVSIVSELETLVDECAKETGILRLRRLKWVLKSKKVKGLVARTRETRQDMMQACQLMGLHISRTHGNILLEVVSMQAELPRRTGGCHHTEIQNANSVHPPKPRHVFEDIPKPQTMSPMKGTIQSDDSLVISSLVSSSNIVEDGVMIVDDMTAAYIRIKTSVPTARVCSASCHCQCHIKRGRFASPGWLNPLIGSLFLNYDCLPFPGRWKCDTRDCFGSSSSLFLDYYFPRWLCSRAISLHAFTSTIVGEGATLHMRIPRIIPVIITECWEYICWNDDVPFRTSLLQEHYLPFDQNEYGKSILVSAIEWRAYNIVNILYQVWQLERPGAKCDRLASLNARLLLEAEGDDLGPSVSSMLQRISLLNDEPDTDDLEIHHAIKIGSGLRDALETNLITLNSTDIYGRTALHLAADEGSYEALRLLIQAGGRLNDKDCMGNTPLHASIQSGNFACATALIEAGCDLSIVDNEGEMPLYYIMFRDLTERFNLLMLMLSKVHVPFIKGGDSQNPLHWFPQLHGPEEHMESVVEFLVKAGANMHARDVYGNTPLTTAIIKTNVAALHLLLKYGAKLDMTRDIWGRNILHNAAMYGRLEILQYLVETDFKDADVDACDNVGDTPLDCWRWRKYENEQRLFGSMRRPTIEENDAFESLLRKLRDQSLKAESDTFGEALQAVKSRDAVRVAHVLRPLREQKLAQQKDRDAETLRVIVDVQVAGGMWSAAEEILEEMIDVREKRMASSPFEERSNHYLPDDPYRYDTDEMEEFDEDDNDLYSNSDSECEVEDLETVG